MDKIRRSKLAEDILNNPLWEEFFTEIKQDLFVQFCNNPDLEAREKISIAVDLMAALKSKCEEKLMDGIQLTVVGDNNG